ncbi:MAG: heme exporter protein CcmD [Rickettsiales bacterium]
MKESMVAPVTYSVFIIAAYAASCAALGLLLAASILRYVLAKKRLDRAQKKQQGVKQ